MSMPVQKPGKSFQAYGTPLGLIAAVEKRFGKLDIDLAATANNHKAPLWLTPEDDSLSVDWSDLSRLCPNMWLNPPYENIGLWAKKCAESSSTFGLAGTSLPIVFGRRLFFLVPASVGAVWFSEYVHNKSLVLALQPRLTFEGQTQPYPKDCILAIYGETPGFDIWRWK